MRFPRTCLCLLAAILAGCDTEMSFTTSQPDEPADDLKVYGGDSQSLRAAGVSDLDDTEKGGTLEDAVATHEEYVATLEENNRLTRENAKLLQQLRTARDEAASLTEENAQLQQELDDATEMLIAMRAELDKWKKDIFAFRKEFLTRMTQMRSDQIKIIRILGGEVPKEDAEALLQANSKKDR